MSVVILDVDNWSLWNDLLNVNEFIIVDVWASWCGPCKAIAPKVTGFAHDFREMQFVKVNIEQFPEFAEKYNVTQLPTFLFFQAGKEHSKLRLVGANPVLLRARLESLLAQLKQ